MSDPIEQLNHLGDVMEGAPMPLPASEIRARGDRIRRRRHTLVAGASAAVVAAVAVPVVALTLGGPDDNNYSPQPSPTVTDPLPRAPLTAANLPTDADAGPAYGGSGEWTTRDTFVGDGQDSFHPCAQTSFAGLGADLVLRREFLLATNVEVPGGTLTAIAGQFPDEATARSAYDDLATTLRDCPTGVPGSGYRVENEADVPADVDAETHRILATYDPDRAVGYKEIMETGLVLAGDRLEVVVSLLGAQDYDFENPPMTAILPAAATRLVLGDGTSTPSRDDRLDATPSGLSHDPSEPAATATVRADFPLDIALGEPPVADSETAIEGPAADAAGADPETACGVALSFPSSGSPDPDHELGYSVSAIEGYDGRTIHAYPTAQDAVDQMEQLRAQLQGCGRDSAGDGLSDRIWRTFNSDTGYDSITFGWFYEATESQGATAGGLYTVERVGNAVVAIFWAGEYSADTQRDQAPDQVELAQQIGDEMKCDFAADGC